MIEVGYYDLLGQTILVRAAEPVASLLADAMADLVVPKRRRSRVLTVKHSDAGQWSVAWPREQRYAGPDIDVAFYDVFGALNEAAARSNAERGDVGLHGGAVEIDGSAIAVVGHSGAGKSTLTAALVLAGGGFIADELASVSAQLGDDLERLQVRPFHRPIGIRVGAAEAIGLDIPSGPYEHTYPLRATSIGRLAQATPLGCIAFVERDPLQPPEVRTIRPPDALHRLSNQTLGAFGLEREMFRRLETIVRNVPAVVLRYGDVDDGVAMAHEALRQ